MWGTRLQAHARKNRRRFIPTRVGNTVSSPPTRTPAPVHPLACGEHVAVGVVGGVGFGSSPRVWGTHSLAMGFHPLQRFIPTRVGNTCPRTHTAAGQPVHPHACGEHSADAAETMPDAGSSPRVWGTHENRAHEPRGPRFIPTRVGNTEPVFPARRRPPVHPHACGEHNPFTEGNRTCNGSSPRVWGTPSQGRRPTRWTRFIPTRVGNTLPCGLNPRRFPVHPHACGEHQKKIIGEKGKLRFIPTRVGNTSRSAWTASRAAVHPHACGEHATSAIVTPGKSGSSPRVWGTPIAAWNTLPRARFIPTRVGNTSSRNRQRHYPAVHPHACGEHRKPLPPTAHATGSSPRVWGTP